MKKLLVPVIVSILVIGLLYSVDAQTADAHGNQCSGSGDCVSNNICLSGFCENGGLFGHDHCIFVVNTRPCNDNNVCTLNDFCSGGSCRSFTSLDCNDGNVCTDDICNPASGCMNPNNVAVCDDGELCTIDEFCTDGVCGMGTVNPIPACFPDDMDMDGISDATDNCPDDSNTGQEDLDGDGPSDGTGDACDLSNDIFSFKTLNSDHTVISNVIVHTVYSLTVPNPYTLTLDSANLIVRGTLVVNGGSIIVS